MCNFYVMYYSDDEPLQTKYCFTNGPPTYRWATDTSLELSNIPDYESTHL